MFNILIVFIITIILCSNLYNCIEQNVTTNVNYTDDDDSITIEGMCLL